MTHATEGGAPRLTKALLVLVLACSFCFGAIVRIAIADDYHTTCVGHGFVHGGSETDGSFFGRVSPGCGSSVRHCRLYNFGTYVGGVTVTGTTATCSAWSWNFGSFAECGSTTHVENPGIFSNHVHKASNWCG